MIDKHKDRPRNEIITMASELLDRANGRAKVYFKFTCPACGERCTLEEPNVLSESGECCSCGVISPIEKAGFMLLLTMSEAKDSTVTTPDNLERKAEVGT